MKIIKEQFNPNLRKSKKNIAKNIFGICFIWFMIFIFTFYMDGETGVILAYFALFSAVLSYLTAYLARKRIKISVECDEYVRKGSDLILTVNVEKTGQLPLAFVDIFISSSEVFLSEEKHYRLSLAFQSHEKFTCKLKGAVGGNGRIYIKEVLSSGFMGIVSYKCEIPEISKNIGVIPDIPEINASNRLFLAVNDSVITSDDEEEDSPLSFSANAVPGYDHREYIEGDSLKRVNWKLSSKKGKLMVRLDEAVSSVQPTVIINLCGKDIFKKEKNIQSAFGFLSLLVKRGISTKVYIKSENNNICCFISESEDSLNHVLMSVLITPDKKITEFDESIFSEKSCSYIVFSPEIPEKLINSVYARSDSTHFITADENPVNRSSAKLWRLNDNNFELV